MSCNRDGDGCSIYLGNSVYPGTCRFIGNGQYECLTQNMLQCETKDNSCMETSIVNGLFLIISGTCKYYANGSWPALGCKVSGSGSGSGSGSTNVSYGAYCQEVGKRCYPNVLGVSSPAYCSPFYTGQGNYSINCEIDWNGGSGSGSGSGNDTFPQNCLGPCSAWVYKNGELRLVNGTQQVQRMNNQWVCVCNVTDI